MLDKLTNHFGVVSALVTVVASFVTLTFVYGYLSPFDNHLIWLVEYTDILKFCLVGTAILSSILLYIMNSLDDLYENWMNRSITGRKIVTVVVLVILSSLLGLFLYLDFYVSQVPAAELHVMMYISIILLLLLYVLGMNIYTVYLAANKQVTWNIRPTLNLLAFAVFTIGLLGRTVGLYVRDGVVPTHTVTFTSESGLLEVTGVRLIMVTSQYTIYQSREGVIAVPSSAVTKMKSNPIIWK